MPAPLRGLNARDSLANMGEGYALTLENWYPRTSYLEVRGGTANHLTGMTGVPKTLAVYNKLDGTSKMYAVTSAGIFDATTAGAVGANLLARTNGKHQYINYGNGTNNYIIMVNGVDKPAYFDGTTWTAVDNVTVPALTGLTTTSIVNVFASKGRLYFIEKNSLSFWYLAAGVVGGALTEFPLDSIAQKGGYLVAGATWTFDGGDGIDDAVVLVTSEGEIIVYRGTNPSSASAWSMVGRFDLGRPLGYRCLQKYMGDLLLITESGAFPLSQSLQSSTVNKEAAITNIIENDITQDAISYGANFGWEMTLLPSQSALILNVPITEDSSHEQYVMNTITKSWCKFTNWNAETFCEFNGDLYYATSTKIVKAWSGTSDLGSNIVATAKSSFSYFGSPGQQKHFTMFRPVLNVNGSVAFNTGLDVDFKDTAILDTANYTVTTAAVWDTAYWDLNYWSAGLEIIRRWTSPKQDIGYCGAVKIKVATNSLNIQWMSNDVVWQTGGVL
jgi:hypothetical protein